jgi:hypothetical protein
MFHCLHVSGILQTEKGTDGKPENGNFCLFAAKVKRKLEKKFSFFP